MASDKLQEIREAREYGLGLWTEIRANGAKNMKFVAGDPWEDEDKQIRKGRPTVAPEEMGQYFNAVINTLRENPRGIKFAATGNGANDAGARFYEAKAREIEYRSHASSHYIIAAQDAIQRSYGFVRVETRYASPRSANQEIYIESFVDPDAVLIDPDAKRPDSSDMQWAMVDAWGSKSEFQRRWKGAKVPKPEAWGAQAPSWVTSDAILDAEYWEIETRPRTLYLVLRRPPQAIAAQLQAAGQPVPMQEQQLFDEDIAQLPQGSFTVVRELRTVDYPSVYMCRTNGVEILEERTSWPGKYIPIVSCYGKILYVPKGGRTVKRLLAMTDFGRDPWKAMCYAASQELEILGMVPKAAVVAYEGQLDGHLKDWQESTHQPKVVLYAKAKTAMTGDAVLPLPSRVEYTQAQYLDMVLNSKEGWRRAIQAAMGSNFLPTLAQKRNEKSGKALDKIDAASARGTYHFIDSYEDMIRQVGVIIEDLIDKIHDYRGEVGVIDADRVSRRQAINDPGNAEAVSTAGDYLVTVSTAPSSDSERTAADEFTDSMVQNLGLIANVAGPKAAAAVLARSIRMRNLGPLGDQLADIVEPAEFKAKDGEAPISPELQRAMAEIQKLQGELQQAGQIIQTEQVKAASAKELKQMDVDVQREKSMRDSETKLAVAELSANVERLTLFVEERARLGMEAADAQAATVEFLRSAHQEALAAASEHALQAKEHAAQLARAQTPAPAPARKRVRSVSRDGSGRIQAVTEEEIE